MAARQDERQGWIKLGRNIRGHWLWERPTYLKWWLDLLMLAEWQPRRRLIGSRLVTVERGQIVASAKYLQERWMYRANESVSSSRIVRPSEHTIANFLRLLESDGLITKDTKKLHNGASLITICDYEKYSTIFEGGCIDSDNTSGNAPEHTVERASGGDTDTGPAGAADNGRLHGRGHAGERGPEGGTARDKGGGSGPGHVHGNGDARGGETEGEGVIGKGGASEGGMGGETNPAAGRQLKNIRRKESKNITTTTTTGACVREYAHVRENAGNLSFAEIPTWDDVMKYFETKNQLHKIDGWEMAAEKFFTHYEATCWRDSKGIPIVNWKARANVWIRDDKSGKTKQTTNDETAKRQAGGDARRGAPADGEPGDEWGAGF